MEYTWVYAAARPIPAGFSNFNMVDAQIETTLGFRLVRVLSESAMADVMLVERDTEPKQLVLKVLRAEATSDPIAVGRFMDEAFVCQQMNHPHVVKSLGAGRTPEGRLY